MEEIGERNKVIISLEGPMGQGKTMAAVALIYTDMMNRHVKVISNIKLNFDHEYMDSKKLIEFLQDVSEHGEAENCDVLIDEAYQIMDSRSNADKLVKLFSYFIVQSRKRSCDIYVCFHHIDSVDKRLRRAISYRGTCNMRNESPCTACNGERYVMAGAKKMNEKKLAIYKNDGVVVPVRVSACETYHGHRTYNLKNLIDEKKFKADESEVFFKPFVKEDDWRSLFDHILTQSEGEKEECERCLGYGETGWSTVRFRDMHYGNPPKSLRIFGPAVWPLYSTKERIPLTQKQLRIKEEDM